jgi:iron complex transport system permease protein
MTSRMLLGAALCAAVFVAVSAGAVRIPLKSIGPMVLARAGLWRGSPSWSTMDETIVFEIRMPRVVTAALVGAALSVAGVLFQSLLRNPLADPYAIGTSGGAAFGAAIGLVVIGGSGGRSVGASVGTVPLFAFAGAVGTTLLVYGLAHSRGRTPVTALLLAGVVVSVTLGYAMSLLLLMSDAYGRDTRVVFAWLLGGVTTLGWMQIAVLAVLIGAGCGITWGWARHLNTLSLGEEPAAAAGLEVERFKTGVILVGSLLTAAAVSAAGLVGFVGLIVPHVARVLGGSNHTRLIPSALLGGATFVVLADLVARTITPPTEIPLGVVTACGGGPLFLYLLRRSRHAYGG